MVAGLTVANSHPGVSVVLIAGDGWSCLCDEGDDDVGGVAVEILASPVVDRGGSGVGVSCGELHVAQRDTGIEGGHDERRAEHVRVHRPDAGLLADRSDPTVGGASVEALTVRAGQDRAVVAFTDGEVDGAGGARHERNGRWFVAVADDPQGAVTALKSEVFDIGLTRFADPQPVEAEQCRQGGVGSVDAFGGEQESAEFVSVETSALAGMDFRAADVLAGLELIRPSMWAKR